MKINQFQFKQAMQIAFDRDMTSEQFKKFLRVHDCMYTREFPGLKGLVVLRRTRGLFFFLSSYLGSFSLLFLKYVFLSTVSKHDLYLSTMIPFPYS